MDFDFQKASQEFTERRSVWTARNEVARTDKINAFVRTMIPIILDKIKVMLDPKYVVTKENPEPPRLYSISTTHGDYSGWCIGNGRCDGWGKNYMLLTTDGKLFSCRERMLRKYKFLGYVDIDSPTKKRSLNHRQDYDPGNGQAYVNICEFAKAIKIPDEEVETIRKTVGPPTILEDEAAMAAAYTPE